MIRQIRLLPLSARPRSLKLLHLRQSKADFRDRMYPTNFFDLVTEPKESSGDGASSSDNASVIYPLRLNEQLRRLAEWAFGPDGIPSLKVIACGDYAYGGRPSQKTDSVDVILCRPKPGSQEGFRILTRFDDECREEREEIIDDYRDFLGACPVDPFFEWSY